MIATLLFAGFIAAAPVPNIPEPEWMQKLRKKYELKEDEYVKRIAPPYINERSDLILGLTDKPKDDEEKKRIEKDRGYFLDNGKWFTVFLEQDGKKLKKRMIVSSMGLSTSPKDQRGDHLFEVHDAVESITGMSAPEFIVDPKHKDHEIFAKENLTVHGDFVVRKNAPFEKLAVSLQKILQEECKVNVKLRVDYVEQEVFVVSGDFELKPPEWRKASANKRMQKLIDVYATEHNLNKEYNHYDSSNNLRRDLDCGDYSAFPIDFVRFVGERVKTRMVWDIDLPSEPKFTFTNHKVRKPNKEQEEIDTDPDRVLKNVSDQTGLKFKKEKRKVPVLVIYPGDDK